MTERTEEMSGFGMVKESRSTPHLPSTQEVPSGGSELCMTTTTMTLVVTLTTQSMPITTMTGQTMATLTGSPLPQTMPDLIDGTSDCKTNTQCTYPPNTSMDGIQKSQAPAEESTGEMVLTDGT